MACNVVLGSYCLMEDSSVKAWTSPPEFQVLPGNVEVGHATREAVETALLQSWPPSEQDFIFS